LGLYHYTTEKRLDTILATGEFRPSQDPVHDSIYGVGWYLTDLPPGTCDYLLMKACWGKTTLYQRIRYYMEIEAVSGGYPTWKRHHVYFVPLATGMRFRLLLHGEVPKCCDDRNSCPNRPG